MSARPVVGISCCTRGLGTETAQVVVERYVEAVGRHADAAPLLIPARPDLLTAEEAAARLDGLLLTGSPSNLAPARYGDPAAGDGPFDAGRDAMTAALIAATAARGRPVFAMCRGFQELNVALGGTLRRDVGAGALPHHAADDVAFAAMFDHGHDVRLAPGGLLAAVLGRDRLRVNSVHYQGIDRLAPGLTAEATAPDGLVEAASGRIGETQVLGVQWHPEWRAERDPASLAFFALFGRALRGDPSDRSRA